MGENIPCVFLPPDFHISDIIAISMFVDEPFETIPKLTLAIDNDEIYLNEGVQVDNKLSWIAESLSKFRELHTNTKRFRVILKQREVDFDLNNLIFLGPTKTAKPPVGLFLLEFTSGFYCNKSEINKDIIDLNLDLILTIDYRNINAIKQQLEALDAAQKEFEEAKNKLVQSGINLEELSEIKHDYEEALKEKRRVQHEFIQQNQNMQEATIVSQSEIDRQAAVDALKQHIEANRARKQVPKEDKSEYQKMKKFRLISLNELKQIFPYTSNKNFCGLTYYQTPSNVKEFNEMRAYLGFATHYIREISNIINVPLPCILVPQAISSRIVSRTSDKVLAIPTDFNANNAKQLQIYEQTLIKAIKYLNRFFMDDNTYGNTLPEYIEHLREIDDAQLNLLIPTSQQ
ncbi:hypothetical protein TVAG_035100 [Trichomonas vaginalis G3]|uniref:Uncharacterized protein n=1 Tax=Trichomonas vaginalis (strain ATCC PRA-98 / G3) TaxID=412133 RepID=A2DAI4_TRIV3|nr:hypothetical protein TVAGG3_0811130 [Trichomonas vaginalis G3]EAY22487.1 hypothetical protein TVAG_035100 [Trichomonas vaginalis G3]KAI5497212.1 hypothetical protein TVAGG3_0811130 [Trichomonas vaginalis G3]|eukprot:XP_001583473.1 hypothetical protein [Trichomonas vaginalis G3]